MNKIIIAGCGFAGFETALRLQKKVKDQARIVVVDKNPVFTFDPWSKKVLSGTDKKSMMIELAPFLSSRGIKFINSTITGIDSDKKHLILGKTKEKYDFLVVALGHVPDFNIPGSQNTLHCNSISDIEKIKKQIESVVMSKSEKEKDLAIVVCGGTSDGVSLVAEINDYLEICCLNHDVRRIDIKLILLEQENKILPYESKTHSIRSSE